MVGAQVTVAYTGPDNRELESIRRIALASPGAVNAYPVSGASPSCYVPSTFEFAFISSLPKFSVQGDIPGYAIQLQGVRTSFTNATREEVDSLQFVGAVLTGLAERKSNGEPVGPGPSRAAALTVSGQWMTHNTGPIGFHPGDMVGLAAPYVKSDPSAPGCVLMHYPPANYDSGKILPATVPVNPLLVTGGLYELIQHVAGHTKSGAHSTPFAGPHAKTAIQKLRRIWGIRPPHAEPSDPVVDSVIARANQLPLNIEGVTNALHLARLVDHRDPGVDENEVLLSYCRVLDLPDGSNANAITQKLRDTERWLIDAHEHFPELRIRLGATEDEAGSTAVGFRNAILLLLSRTGRVVDEYFQAVSRGIIAKALNVSPANTTLQFVLFPGQPYPTGPFSR
jgi:hypothetical protein